MSELAENLRSEFCDKEYRHAYADEFLNSYIATQIKVLREQRGWSQERLAQEADMKQSRISLLENVGYSSWSISTLKRLAEAFDLTLRVSFESFGSRLTDVVRFSRESLERFSFDEDVAFSKQQLPELLNARAAMEGLKPMHESLTEKRNEMLGLIEPLRNKSRNCLMGEQSILDKSSFMESSEVLCGQSQIKATSRKQLGSNLQLVG